MLLETLFPDLYTTSNYTRTVPYNLVKLNDTQFCLEFNVAGMEEDELDIEVQKNKLYVSAKPKTKDEKDYVVNYISHAAFSNVFTLKDDIQVGQAKLKNGILSIVLELVVPEEKKPKKILLTH